MPLESGDDMGWVLALEESGDGAQALHLLLSLVGAYGGALPKIDEATLGATDGLGGSKLS
jgi:hypothetical protein